MRLVAVLANSATRVGAALGTAAFTAIALSDDNTASPPRSLQQPPSIAAAFLGCTIAYGAQRQEAANEVEQGTQGVTDL
jgi:hypothetical protein